VGAAAELLRRNPDLRRLWLASVVTAGGDWFAVIPLLALLHELTGGGLAGGLVLAADTAVFALLLPYAGTLADRLDRKRIIVTADSASAGFALLLLLVHGAAAVPVAVLAIGAIAAAKAFSEPAAVAATPNLVAPEDLGTANVVFGVTWGSTLAVGAALGGLGSALFGAQACFVLDAVSFVGSAVLVGAMRVPFQQPREQHTRLGLRSELRDAAAYARSDRRVLALLTAKPGVGFANGALVLFPLLATDLGTGTAGLGLLYAARGLGALLGPLVLGRRGRDERLLRVVVPLSIGSCGALYVGVAGAPVLWLVLVLVTLAHLGGGANWTASSYGLQRLVPDAVRGRISSADFMLCTLVIAINQAVAGVLSETVATRTLVAAFGGASVVYAAGWLAATRSLRPAPLESGA
jgi:MFS family permease